MYVYYFLDRLYFVLQRKFVILRGQDIGNVIEIWSFVDYLVEKGGIKFVKIYVFLVF